MKRFFAALTAGALSSHCARQVLVKQGHNRRWDRKNYHDATVNLRGGVQTALATSLGLLVSAKTLANSSASSVVLGAAAATTAAGVCGYIDDMDDTRNDYQKVSKGFHGHLGALKEGRVTTGLLKIVGIGASAAVVSFSIAKANRDLTPLGRLVRGTLSTGLIAGSANLANLFDLRPGRMQKVVLASALPLALRQKIDGSDIVAAIITGTAATGMKDDLQEITMNGDTGANALGAGVGVALTGLRIPAQICALVAIGGLTLASEKISFTKVIEQTPLLKWADGLGRR
ncbi:MAG: hypothetical protein Q4P66_03565 [Actinomycetaceae bacterium]|nr:hypothetical protein [Actinomycetaceae bacterium]